VYEKDTLLRAHVSQWYKLILEVEEDDDDE
jgi:hypothetical protein